MFVPILLGSASDQPWAKKITDVLDEFAIPYDVIVASAHKVPEKVLDIVHTFNKRDDEICYITIAGRSNGLSGVTAGTALHPVIACPPFSDKADYAVNIHSTLQMPSDTPVLTVIDPVNAALSVVRIFALNNPDLHKKLQERIQRIKASF
jgi:5-(carboxyamino)imidazole ribonucleotide mutase